MGDKLLNFLGIARRAGKLIIGCEPVIESVRNGKSGLVMMASDISKNTSKTVLKNITDTNYEIITLNKTKEELTYALGKSTAVLSIDDKGFIDKIKLLNSDINEA